MEDAITLTSFTSICFRIHRRNLTTGPETVDDSKIVKILVIGGFSFFLLSVPEIYAFATSMMTKAELNFQDTSDAFLLSEIVMICRYIFCISNCMLYAMGTKVIGKTITYFKKKVCRRQVL